MLSTATQSAVSQLQHQARRHCDVYELDRHDRALDELLRHPGNTSPAAFQRRSALANAAKVIQRRRQICPTMALGKPSARGLRSEYLDPPDRNCAIDALDIHLWLATTPSLTATQRRILQHLAVGHDAASLADTYQVPVARMRERISRARAAGWTAYQREVGVQTADYG